MPEALDVVISVFDLIKGIFIDEEIRLGYAAVYISNIITDEFSNYALAYSFESQTKELVHEIEKTLEEKHRKPAIYITPATLPTNLGDILVNNFGYSKSWTDAWMTFQNNAVLPDWEKTKEIVHIGDNPKLISMFGDVIRKAYSGPKTPENPYGGIPMDSFIEATRAALSNPSLINKFEGYLAISDGKPVASSLLIHDDQTGYVCGVASVPEVRGKGFGKLVSQYAIKRSIHIGCKNIWLATERDSKNEEFYKRIGFQTEFVCTCYVK